MSAPLPGIDASTGALRWLWLAAIGAAFAALAVLGARIVTRVDLGQWWVPLVFAASVLGADFASGVVHWSADTWGRDDLPVIGRRLLVPFRLHHVNPDDFLRRNFADTNGDVALLAAGPIAALAMMPLDEAWQRVTALGGFGLCGAGMLTNQIHQWAHMPSPPRPIRFLQNVGILLGRDAHATHHNRPYDAHYCITTGWCNRPLDAIGFFRGFERAITRVTGARPRHDDERYERRYGSGIASFATDD